MLETVSFLLNSANHGLLSVGLSFRGLVGVAQRGQVVAAVLRLFGRAALGWRAIGAEGTATWVRERFFREVHLFLGRLCCGDGHAH